MSEDRREHLVQAQRLRALVQFLSKLLSLAVQLKKYLRLVLENMGLNRLVDEVDRA